MPDLMPAPVEAPFEDTSGASEECPVAVEAPEIPDVPKTDSSSAQADIVPDTQVLGNMKPVSRVAQILAITSEQKLVLEMTKFEDSIYERVHPLRVLLSQDIHSVSVTSIQNHMTDVERWRETVLRWASLAKTFVTHCKSDHFILKREQGMKITEFDREGYQKKLLAGFVGLEYWLDGMVSNIDSRVNMAKVLLRLDESGTHHPGASQRVA